LLAAFGLMFILGIALPGCKSDSEEPAPTPAPAAGQTTAGMSQTRTQLMRGQQQLQATMAALAAVQAPGSNVQQTLAKLGQEIAATEQVAKVISDQSRDMQARAEEYRAKWVEEAAELSSLELRVAAARRSALVRERFAGISQMMTQVSEAYQPFMRDLKELQTYLVNDSTPAAVSAASGFFQKTTASGQTLTTRLDALVTEVNSLAAELAPTTAPAQN
jgi:hypothetical protein